MQTSTSTSTLTSITDFYFNIDFNNRFNIDFNNRFNFDFNFNNLL